MNDARGNRELNRREIADGAPALRSFPVKLLVTLSTRCNAGCIMCEVRRSRWDIPRRTLGEIAALFPHLESVAWQGGEVFYLDFFEELFDAARAFPHLKQTIVTNGLLLDRKWIEKLVSAPLELAVSVDGVTRGVYEKIRRGSDFDVLRRNLALLNEARRERASTMSLRMHVVVMKSNLHQAGEFIEWAREFRFDALHMMPLWGDAVPGEDIFSSGTEEDLRRLEDALSQTTARAKRYAVEFLHSLPVAAPSRGDDEGIAPRQASRGPADGTPLCFLPWQQMNVDPGGNVRPGCLCPRSIGSVETAGLMDLWNGGPMQEYRRKVLEKGAGWCLARCVDGSMPLELRMV